MIDRDDIPYDISSVHSFFFFYMQFLIYNLSSLSFTRVPDLVIFLLNDSICYFIILHSYGISVGDIYKEALSNTYSRNFSHL